MSNKGEQRIFAAGWRPKIRPEMRPEMRSGRNAALAALAAVCLLALSGLPAWAIPSPELVIGSLSSVSQLFAVGTAMLGGGAAAVGMRSNRRGAPTSRTAFRLAWLFFAAFLISIGGLIYQYLQFQADHMARLQSTLLRPAEAPQTGKREFKTLSFAAQKAHPLAISTSDAARLLHAMNSGKDKSPLFLDIRETPENETGTLPGATHIRFPDLPLSKMALAGRKVILFCHNGNRSYETCAALAAQGIDCRFLAGGIEKWIVEGRAFSNAKVRGLADLRAVPAYRNDRVLLDTPDVKALVEAENAALIDVRYPGAFARNHLPGAINIPLRATPTKQLREKISQLPKRPLVIACYDRRGCFAGQVLGLELIRAGYDYRGRYTLPWEFYIAKPAKPHVQAWMAEQQRGLWQKAVALVAGWLGRLADQWGFLAAIVVLAAVSRLIILPVSVKAERDQIVLRQADAEKRAIEARLADDPPRLARALRAFYAKHGLTPGRNLLALAFLPLLAIGLSAVEQAGRAWSGAMIPFWPALDAAPFWLWPVMVAVVAGIYMQVTLVRTRRHQIYVWALGAPLVGGLAVMLSKAGNLYLLVSLAMLLAQRLIISGALSRGLAGLTAQMARFSQWRAARSGAIPLAFPTLLADSGNKAYRLAQLRAHGVSVPDGVVLTDQFLQKFTPMTPRRRRRHLNRLWRATGRTPLAVRSSASCEDGAGQSFAGVFDSVLNVARADLESAVKTVQSSFAASKAKSYASDAGSGNILLQQMVDAEYSGVLFTKDPQAPGLVLVELVEGTADALVSGQVTPQAFRFGRVSHDLASPELPPIDLTPLLEIGTRSEAIFAAPQDIEWTFKEGIFRIVQSRDITVGSGKDAAIAREWERIFNVARQSGASDDTIIFRQDEMSEVLPHPTLMSLSVMQALWAPGGSVDLACRELGLTYPIGEDSAARLTTLFGHLYTNQCAAKASAVQISRGRARRLEKSAEALETAFLEHFMPDFLSRMKLLEVAHFGSLTAPESLRVTGRLIEDFVTSTHVEVEKINIAADYFMSRARAALQRAGLSPAQWLTAQIHVGPAAVIDRAAKLPETARRDFLLAELGHRAGFDYELSAARYWEAPELLDGFCQAPAPLPETSDGEANTAVDVNDLSPRLAKLVQRAQRFQGLKEDAKHLSLRQYAVLRKALMACDRLHNFSGLVFYLTTAELMQLGDADQREELRNLANARLSQEDKFTALPPLAAELTLRDLERASAPAGLLGEKNAPAAGALSGQLVSGDVDATGPVKGPAFVASGAGEDFTGFHDGDIIVCRMVDPAWLPYVLRSAGVVSEVGGWLSHMAIVAREHNVPMIVGAKGATGLAAGTPLQLHEDGRVEVALEPADRTPTVAPMVAE